MDRKNNECSDRKLPVKDIEELTLEQINGLSPEKIYYKYLPHSNDIVATVISDEGVNTGIEIPFSIMQEIYCNMKFFGKSRTIGEHREKIFKKMVFYSRHFRKYTKEDREEDIPRTVKDYIEHPKHKRLLENYSEFI